MTSLNSYSADHYGDMESLIQIQEALRDTISKSPHFYFFILNRSLMMRRRGMDSLSEKLLMLRTNLLRERIQHRGINPDSLSVDYSVTESTGKCIEAINALIADLNIAIALYTTNINARESFTSTQYTPHTQTISLQRISTLSDISMGAGPYLIDVGDSITVDGDTAYLPSTVCSISATKAWPSDTAVKAGLVIEVHMRGNTTTITVDPFPLNQVLPVPEDEDEEEYFGEEESSIPDEGYGYVEDLLEVSLSSYMDVDFADGLLTLTPNRSDVLSIKVVGGLLRDLLGFPKKTVPANSCAYTTAEQLSLVIGGVVVNNLLYTGTVSVIGGKVTSPSMDKTRAILAIGDTYYVVGSDGSLDLMAGRDVYSTDYMGHGRVYTEELVLESLSVSSGVVGFGGVSDAGSDISSDAFTHNGVGVLAGDYVTPGEGLNVKASGGGELTLNRPILDLEITVDACDYAIASSILSELTTAPQISDTFSNIPEINRLDGEVLALEEYLVSMTAIINRGKSTLQYRQFCRALSAIGSAHLDLGFDRALDMLYSGDFERYFNVEGIGANYLTYAAKTSRDVSRRMQTL
jgi:hypothetical protein